MSLAVPETLEAIDAAWMSEALGWPIDTIAVEQIAVGSAFLGTVARVRIGETAAAQTVIVKIPATDPGALAVGQMLNVWHREALFYERLAPQLPASTSVPRALRTVVEPGNYRAAVVLEDMAPAMAGDQIAGASPAAARAAVLALAGLHAPWWGKPRTPDQDWVPGIDRPTTGQALQGAMESSFDRFEARFGPRLPAQTVEWTRRFIPQVADYLRHMATRPLTIAHADYRLENMLFSPDDDSDVTVVDWQTAMYTGGGTDLSFFLTTSLPIETRRELEAELCSLYTDNLVAHGVDIASTNHVADDYRSSMLWWMAMLANNLADIATPDQRSADLFDAMLLRLHTAALDHDLGEFV